MEMTKVVKPVYNFKEMGVGAKRESLRDFLGSISDKSNIDIIGSLLNALSKNITAEQYAGIAEYMYENNERFCRFAETGNIDEEVEEDIPVDETEYVRNPMFDKIMEASYNGVSDWMPNCGRDGVIYKASAYTHDKRMGLPAAGIPVVSIDDGSYVGMVYEYIEKK